MRVMTGNDHTRSYNLDPTYTIEQYNNHTATMPLFWVVSPNKAGKPVRRPAVINRFVIKGWINRFEFNLNITVFAHIGDQPSNYNCSHSNMTQSIYIYIHITVE